MFLSQAWKRLRLFSWHQTRYYYYSSYDGFIFREEDFVDEEFCMMKFRFIWKKIVEYLFNTVWLLCLDQLSKFFLKFHKPEKIILNLIFARISKIS